MSDNVVNFDSDDNNMDISRLDSLTVCVERTSLSSSSEDMLCETLALNAAEHVAKAFGPQALRIMRKYDFAVDIVFPTACAKCHPDYDNLAHTLMTHPVRLLSLVVGKYRERLSLRTYTGIAQYRSYPEHQVIGCDNDNYVYVSFRRLCE